MHVMAATRADLAFLVSVVSQHTSKYGPKPWAAVMKVIEFKYVPTQGMVVDVLIKILGKPQHQHLVEKMGH